jgi:hypothetical protein
MSLSDAAGCVCVCVCVVLSVCALFLYLFFPMFCLLIHIYNVYNLCVTKYTKIQPLSKYRSNLLDDIRAKAALFKKYTFEWLRAVDGDHEPPEKLVQPIIVQCLDLLDLLVKVPHARRFGTNINEYIKEAEKMDPFAFALFYVGSPNTIIQKMCLELKLIDAVFESINAIYNFNNVTGNVGGFPEQFRAVQKYL